MVDTLVHLCDNENCYLSKPISVYVQYSILYILCEIANYYIKVDEYTSERERERESPPKLKVKSPFSREDEFRRR